MNKKSVKRPFILCTVAAMLTVFLLAAVAITYAYAQNYINDVDNALSKRIEALASDLNYCRDVNRESVEYRDGINVAQAYMTMRYYRFIRLKDLKEKDALTDIGLYQVEKGENGEDIDFWEVIPRTTTILDAPFSTRSSIIVLEDAFSEEQVEQIEAVIEKGEFTSYIEDARGYKEGRIFYPTEINIGKDEDIVIKAEQKGRLGKLVTEDLQDIQIVHADGRITGGHQRERRMSDDFRKGLEEEERRYLGTVDGGSIYEDTSERQYDSDILDEVTLVHSKTLRGTDYVVKMYAQIHPIRYAAKALTGIYIALFTILFLVTLILISVLDHLIAGRLETEEKRRHMMDSMAHEMKTPLSVIKNYSEVLLEEADPEKCRYYTKSIIDEADGMNQAVISMLDFSKMEAGTYPMELSSVSISDLARSQLQRAKILMDRKGLQLEAKIQEDVRLFADEKLVNNILANFLSNGINHTSAGGTLRLEVEAIEDEVYIAVFNQGKHILEKEMERLWESFYRNRSTNEESSGLGLAIVRNAALMHNGTYGCSNEEDGVRFWVKIKSMEGSTYKSSILTGPVIGVTGAAYRIFGTVLIGFGTLLQTFTVFYHLSDTWGQINLWLAGELSVFFRGVTDPWVPLIGTIIVGFGVYRLYRNDLMDRRWFVLPGIMAASIVAIRVLGTALESTGIAILLGTLSILWVVAIGAISLQCFRICMKIALEKSLMPKYRKLRFGRNLYIIGYIACIAASYFVWGAINMEIIPTLSYYYLRNAMNLLPLLVMFSSFRAWRWFSGRIKKL